MIINNILQSLAWLIWLTDSPRKERPPVDMRRVKWGFVLLCLLPLACGVATILIYLRVSELGRRYGGPPLTFQPTGWDVIMFYVVGLCLAAGTLACIGRWALGAVTALVAVAWGAGIYFELWSPQQVVLGAGVFLFFVMCTALDRAPWRW